MLETPLAAGQAEVALSLFSAKMARGLLF